MQKNMTAFSEDYKIKLEGIETGAQKNDIDQIKAVLTTDTVIDGTEQMLAFDTSSEAQGLSMPSNGIFEVGRDGYYTGHINMYMWESGDPDFIMWIECRDSGIDPWEFCGGQMVEFHVASDTGTTVPFNSNFNFVTGQQFRIMIKKISAGDSAELQTKTETVSLGTLTQYPASVTIFRAGNKITV
jgi:hypothetical protein